MATYVNDLRLKEIATGDESGTWGTSTNTNLELIGEALGYGTQEVFSSDADATTTIADGASDPARAMYFKITSGVSLTATRTCTIAPNTVSRVMFIENATTGSQSITISQGSGANVTIATGRTAVVYLDGAGSGAAVVDALALVDPGVTDTLAEVLVAGNTSGGTNIELTTTDKVQFRDTAIYINSSADGQLDIVADTEVQIAATTIDVNGTLAFDSLKGTGATTVTNILDEDNMGSDSATALATQQSIKAYVDSQVGTVDTLAEILANGNTTGGTDIAVGTGDDITFADSSKAIFGAGSDLEIYHDGLNSYIKDAGTGNLNIQTNGVGVVIEHTDGTNLAVFNAGDGTASLYHSGNLKLATTATGIDVTGTVTADGGDFSGLVQFNGTAGIQLDNAAQVHSWTLDDNFTSRLNIGTSSASAAWKIGSNNNAYLTVSPTGIDVTGTVTTTGNVGIGGAPSAYNLDIYGAGGASMVVGAATGRIFLYGDNTGTTLGSLSAIPMRFYTNGAEAMRIDASGRQLIGYTSSVGTAYQTNLQVKGSSASNYGGLGVISTNNEMLGVVGTWSNGENSLMIAADPDNLRPSSSIVFTTDATEAMRIDASGNVGIGRTPDANGVLQLNVASGLNTNLTFAENSVNKWMIGSLTSSNALRFYDLANSREAMRIDASGNVGIGTSSPDSPLEIQAATNSSSDTTYLKLYNAGENVGHIDFENGNGSLARITGTKEGSGSSANEGILTFSTAFDASLTERMRLDSSGNLLVGTTVAANQGVTIYGNGANGLYSKTTSTSAYWITNDGLTSATGTLFTFYNNTTPCGGITITSTNVTNYNSVSDERLKENIADADDAGSKIDSIQVRKFDWKADGSHQDYGMVAQELLEVAPEAVSVPEDPEEMMAVDPAKLVPMMLKEIQSLRARVAALES